MKISNGINAHRKESCLLLDWKQEKNVDWQIQIGFISLLVSVQIRNKK